MTIERPYNGGRWTQSRYNSFIMSALRRASVKWPPKYEVRKKSKVAYNKYKCSGYRKRWHYIPNKEVAVDHINPVIDPNVGFVSWDDTIARLFCEEDNLQVLCKECHKLKTAEERNIANARKK